MHAMVYDECSDSDVMHEGSVDYPMRQRDQQGKTLRAAIEVDAWDSKWYPRAFFGDGSPLGSKSNDE